MPSDDDWLALLGLLVEQPKNRHAEIWVCRLMPKRCDRTAVAGWEDGLLPD
jgi:hypothetical protein